MRVPNEASGPRRRPWAIVVAILVAVPLTAGIVQAAIPDVNGEITVCYKAYTGEMRLIDTASVPACKSDETELSWNQQGPQGEPGLSGYRVKFQQSPDINAPDNSNDQKQATAECDPGSVVIGTGVTTFGHGQNPIDGPEVAVRAVFPFNSNTAVRATASEVVPGGTPKDWVLVAYAFCAKVQP